MANDRRPRFPPGVVGTLAHDRDIAVAATTTVPEYRALGIDIEPDTVLDDEMASVIRRSEERHLDAHLVFALKEAAYKAWSSTGGRILEHHDVRVDIDSPGVFRAEVIPDGAWMTGRFTAVADRYVALVTVDGRAGPGSGRELRRRA
jgi:4'-phosphopantetheinyl transferase EntD